jgi:hypothetical protein
LPTLDNACPEIILFIEVTEMNEYRSMAFRFEAATEASEFAEPYEEVCEQYGCVVSFEEVPESLVEEVREAARARNGREEVVS